MTIYKITISNRNYTDFNIFNATTLEAVHIDEFNPFEHKLVNNDVFTYNDKQVVIIHSSTRLNENIPAVLLLDGNKTYGRDDTTKKEGRLLYKCVPDDVRIPAFLVPYEIKTQGFSKVLTNLYVTISFREWTNKHPTGLISQTIGPVSVLENFYEYQLYCKSLNNSIQKFNKATLKAVKDNAEEHDTFISNICHLNPQIEDRTALHTFTIDPPTSLDFDDGFSIQVMPDNRYKLSIYIANVTILMNSLNLWSSFSQRISTIYLPDRKRPMLPTILSDCLCSLQANARRFAFVLDIIIDSDGNILSQTYSNCLIRVRKNYAYEADELLVNEDYQLLFRLTKKMATKYKYINAIRNSHDLVCYLMILMNFECAQDLLLYKNGIFRSTIIKKEVDIPNNLPEDVGQFIKIWNSACGQYVDISSIKEEISIKHELLEMDAYIHITSPIRRLVDLLNMIRFQQNRNLLVLSPDASEFYSKWIAQIDYINTTMRAIRKVQNDCVLLDNCCRSPEMLEQIYDGYCFDRLVRNDGLYQYIVFLPQIKMAYRITMRECLANFEKRQYKLYLFNNEEQFKKKIRLQLLNI
jgi:exoribonuclease R